MLACQHGKNSNRLLSASGEGLSLLPSCCPTASNAPDRSEIAVRNNAASLLADLLGDEKNVSKILIIKSNSDELGKLMKAISKTADDGKDQLEALAKADSTLNLNALQLPPGEIATRKDAGISVSVILSTTSSRETHQ